MLYLQQQQVRSAIDQPAGKRRSSTKVRELVNSIPHSNTACSHSLLLMLL